MNKAQSSIKQDIKCETVKDFIMNHTSEEISDMEYLIADMREMDIMRQTKSIQAGVVLEMAADSECVVIYREEHKDDIQ